MATTTNFGWETPDDTDLVKDGAAAIRTALGGVDTSFVDLKGGTTGQVLAKASGTDLDFSWVAVDPLTILDAKGDLITATAADTPARLAVGTNGQTLVADSTASTGLKWATPAGGGKVLQVVQATYATGLNSSSNTWATTGLSASITPSVNTSKVLIMISQNGLFKSNANTTTRVGIRLKRDSTVIITPATYMLFSSSALELNGFGLCFNYLDSPATTSAITYTTEYNSGSNVATVGVQQNSETSTIILLEIGA